MARPVDEVQVDVPEVEVGQTTAKAGEDLAGAVVLALELGGDEDLLPVEPRIPYGLPDLSLVAVVQRGVDQPIAGLKCP